MDPEETGFPSGTSDEARGTGEADVTAAEPHAPAMTPETPAMAPETPAMTADAPAMTAAMTPTEPVDSSGTPAMTASGPTWSAWVPGAEPAARDAAPEGTRPWGPALPGPAVQPVASPRRRRPVAAIVAAAVLSALLSSAGTYAVITAALPGATTTTTISEDTAIVQVAADASKSVVTITTTGTAGLSPFSVPESGAGSGVIITSGGLILTANHVIAGVDSLTVDLPDGRQVSGKVVATDPTHDLALVQAAATGLAPATLGDSAHLTVGQLAIAIGSPLGTFTDTVTHGIVSALDRTISVSSSGFRGQVTRLSGLIQTDAPINPGNSGGPLLDSSGAVIGIVTAQASSAEGIGFAVPIDAARPLIQGASGA
jgi:hypothetical protein